MPTDPTATPSSESAPAPHGFRWIEISDPDTSDEGLRVVTVPSAALGRRADVSLWAPPGVSPDAPLPLVLLLHGVFGSHWGWSLRGHAHRTAARLVAAGEIPPLVLAMPSDGLAGDGSGYVARPGSDVPAWIVDEVPRVASALWPGCLRGERFIAGLSMGGFGALRLAAMHPGRFAAVAAHSSITEASQLDPHLPPTRDAWPPAPADRRVLDAWTALRDRAATSGDRLPAVRFDCGVDDFQIEANRALHAAMQSAGIAHEYAEHPGGHDWDYWREHLADTLRFFFTRSR
jgi:enterochelin esterase-like enzyme